MVKFNLNIFSKNCFDCPWLVVFAVGCWIIWKNKNATCEIILEANKVNILKTKWKNEYHINWQCPPQGWTKINPDGSTWHGGFSCGCGGLFRDEHGNWVLGFAIKLGDTGTLGAELWEILPGLEIAWRRNFKNIWLEYDSNTAVTLIYKSCRESHPMFNLIETIKETMNKIGRVKITHGLREANKPPDWLANRAHELEMGTTIFEVSPGECRSLLEDDRRGVAFPRFIYTS